MIASEQYNKLTSVAARPAAMLYTCPDGSFEFMQVEGGTFEIIDCPDPRVFPLAGGPMTGRRLSSIAPREGS